MQKRFLTKIAAACKTGQPKIGTLYSPFALGNKYDKVIPSFEFDRFNGYQQLYDTVFNVRSNNPNEKILIVGGDHSISIGSISALNDVARLDEKLSYVLWIDAHADINTFKTSLSGNIHGMPVAFLLGLCRQPYVKMKTFLSSRQIIYIGLRDLDQAEKDFLSIYSITHYNMSDIKKMGINRIINEIKQKVGSNKVHISLDTDAIDPSEAPSTGTPVVDGMMTHDVIKIITAFDSSQMNTMDVVEFNPMIGTSHEVSRTINTLNKCIDVFVRN